MAKLTSKAIEEALHGKIAFNEDLTPVQEPILKVWEDNLPEGLNVDLITKLTNYRKTFSGGFTAASGNAIVDEVQKNDAIESLSLVFNTPDVDFETHYTKPQNENPTQKDHEAAWGFGYGVAKSAAIEKTHRKALAARFLIEDEE